MDNSCTLYLQKSLRELWTLKGRHKHTSLVCSEGYSMTKVQNNKILFYWVLKNPEYSTERAAKYRCFLKDIRVYINKRESLQYGSVTASLFTPCEFRHHFLFSHSLLFISASPPQCVWLFCPVSLTPTKSWHPLPGPCSGRGFFLSKWSFSFSLLPSVGSLPDNIRYLEVTVAI